MNILIEGNRIDFKLEHEKNLKDVIDSLEKWLSSYSQIIREIKVNGNFLENENKKQLNSKLIKNTDVLEISTVNKYEFGIELLVELQEYLQRILSMIDLKSIDFLDMNNKNQLIEGLVWIYDLIKDECNMLHLDSRILFSKTMSLSDVLSMLSSIKMELEENKFNDKLFINITFSKVKQVIQIIHPFLLKMTRRSILELSSSNEIFNQNNLKFSIEDLLEDLDHFISFIPKISSYLHIGQEAKAYTDIKNLLGMIESLVLYLKKLEVILNISYVDYIVAGKSIEEENKELNELMQQLSESISNRDIVLIGDLLEYELLGKLEKYKIIFKEFIAIIEKNKYN